MSWWQAAPTFLAAAALLLLPGVLVITALRFGLVARAAVGGLASVGLIGVAGVVFGGIGMSFAAWQPFVLAVPAAIVVWFIDRRRTRIDVRMERSRWRWIVLTWIATAAVIAVVAYAGVSSPDRVSQTYDNVFHMSAIASILDGGSASSLTLRTLIETDRSVGFYPAAWHSLVAAVAQVGGATPTVAVNASWLAVAAVVWVPGAAWLAQIVLRRFEPGAVALVAMPLAAVFGAMPYSLLSWGSLYPTFLATAILPVAVAVPVLAGRALAEARGLRRWRVAVLGALGILGVMGAIAFAQPRVLASWTLLLAPAVIAAAVGLVRRAWVAGGAARRRAVWSLLAGGAALLLAAAAGFAYLVAVLGLFDRPLEERLGGPQAAATQTVVDGLWQAFAQAWPTGVAGEHPWTSVLLALAVLGGIAVALRRRGLRWVVVSYVAVVILFALAAGADDVFSKLATALWYKDRFRLSSVAPVLGVALATLGIITAATWINARRRREHDPVGLSVILTWVVALSSSVVLVFTGMTSSVATVFRLPASHAVSEVVSQAQIDFMAELGRIVPEGQRVLGDPWDGSGWTQLFGDREPVFPHVNGQWDAARLSLAYDLDAIGVDSAVCAALDKLRVRYVLYNPHEFGGGDPAGNHFIAVHRAVEAGLFTAVSSDGDSTLFRIDQCGALS